MDSSKQEQEISMKEIMEMCLLNRWIIVKSVLFCVLVSVVLSFFVITPVYESKASYLVNPIHLTSGINLQAQVILNAGLDTKNEANEMENRMRIFNSIINQLDYPVFDAQTMSKYMNSIEYLNKVLKANNIDLSKYKYKKNIKISIDEKSGMIAISVKHQNPEMARKICGDLAGEFPKYMSVYTNEKLDEVEAFINEGMENERESKSIWEERASQLLAPSNDTAMEDSSTSQEYERDEIDRNLLLSKQTIEVYQIISKELVSIRRIDVATQMNMKQIEGDQLPLRPISPRKSVNILVSIVVGLMLGVLITYSLDCMKGKYRRLP